MKLWIPSQARMESKHSKHAKPVEEKRAFCEKVGTILKKIHNVQVGIPPLRVESNRLFKNTREWMNDHLKYILKLRVKDKPDVAELLLKQQQLLQDESKWIR